jgi:hypothetical protein
MSCEEEKYLLTYGYVLSCQPHITRKQLEDAEDAFDAELEEAEAEAEEKMKIK